ncbi:MAG: ABC transporter ATP-binding protein [Candidatus Heimdallarchaeota archaeon]|nr:ABC transporter ATP-binding protein [Candidatus Heimdallarchaeota archaeon]
MPQIKFLNISKKFEDSIAIKNISFALEKGELLTLLGPSGSGKTTILRLIAGLIEPDNGQILVDEVDISKTPTENRNIGFVFQSYALFPHLTVVENIAFGLETRKWTKEEKTIRVKELLELVDLTGKGKRFPRELSGGEKSRVALARALAPKPSLLLLDEPLSALDMSLKENLRAVIRNIQQQVKVSTIYVTHDQKEAMEISDRIIILNQGEIVEIGTPQELYLKPKKKFTASFLGISNILEGKINFLDKYTRLETSIGFIELPELEIKNKDILSIALFPEHITLSKNKQGNANEFPAKIIKANFGGSSIEVIVQINKVNLDVKLISSIQNQSYKKDDQVFVTIPVSSILVLEE